MKTVAIVSGGMDSAVLLYDLIKNKEDIHALGVNYGQRHVKELEFAARMCDNLDVSFKVADLSQIGKDLLSLSGSSQVSDTAVPHGHYADNIMKATVIPNRNMIMLSVAVGYALSIEATSVAYGAHKGDSTIYPDCRPEFAEKLDWAVRVCDWHSMQLRRPFMDLTLTQICKLGNELGVDFTQTWSCYEGKAIHCGQCGTCYERREAFVEAGVPDPTQYLETPTYRDPTA